MVSPAAYSIPSGVTAKTASGPPFVAFWYTPAIPRERPNKKSHMTNRMGATDNAAPGWANRMIKNTTRNPPPRTIPSCLTTTELVITGI
ncbi:MAG: hypothetical protein BWY05_01413 [Euryarchaeota archaeon ADurb.Bin165]|nr:MAG: hypothetical protein BWY05_01413 [Euryarchaeota archaeon ADurb.Bin165]